MTVHLIVRVEILLRRILRKFRKCLLNQLIFQNRTREAKVELKKNKSNNARQLGVDVAKVKIVDNRYRWGSCTINNNVNLNWRLIKAPMFVIDYVIVHELAHLIESNHTPRFWNIVRSQIPTTDKAKRWLKENGQLLEQTL
ncbi:M48 family metallopeptidase [Peribacillus simplex]|uniref:M48 metallopeptidase family protein n=1 Tax=Peribacillus simplex TaxID=1478 RepID=UPI003D01ABA7